MGRGVVAVGDSITRGKGGHPVLGIHPQSWAQWVAETLELPLLNLGADTATAADVVRDQLPRLAGRHALATLFIGANDARQADFDGAAFDRDVATVTDALADAADRVLVLTLPHELGRPSAGADIATANGSLRRHAARTRATVCELTELHGPRVMLPDAVHPTTPGMVAIADRALAALGDPRRVASDESRLLHHRVRYGAFYLKVQAQDTRRRLRRR